jgi:3-oxoacyl-[acyl-carrier protein] reductase
MSATAARGRVGQTDDIADVAAFLASDDSRWVTAQRIQASGGAHL